MNTTGPRHLFRLGWALPRSHSTSPSVKGASWTRISGNQNLENGMGFRGRTTDRALRKDHRHQRKRPPTSAGRKHTIGCLTINYSPRHRWSRSKLQGGSTPRGPPLPPVILLPRCHTASREPFERHQGHNRRRNELAHAQLSPKGP